MAQLPALPEQKRLRAEQAIRRQIERGESRRRALVSAHDSRRAAGLSAPNESGRRNVSRLKISEANSKPLQKAATSQAKLSPSVRDDKRPHCKARPRSNRPSGGKGSGKRFVPWCG